MRKAATGDKSKQEHTKKEIQENSGNRTPGPPNSILHHYVPGTCGEKKFKKPQRLSARTAKLLSHYKITMYFALQQNVKLSPNSKFGNTLKVDFSSHKAS